MTASRPLTVREHTAIRLAARRYKYEGARETDVLHELGMTATRFWQYVNALIDRPEAVAAYPVDVRRLVRLREQRKAQRSPRRIPA